MGIVEAVAEAGASVEPGARVLAPFATPCGACAFCPTRPHTSC
ncbi:hypothetical protein B9H04_15990, partial [Halorubrum ezzemoulense DSM 17463]